MHLTLRRQPQRTFNWGQNALEPSQECWEEAPSLPQAAVHPSVALQAVTGIKEDGSGTSVKLSCEGFCPDLGCRQTEMTSEKIPLSKLSWHRQPGQALTKGC